MGMQPTPYERLGGAEKIRGLVDRFYELMDTLPEAAAIRRLHPDDLSGSREKLFQYLSGWLGGPPLYTEKRGHPRLRQRHFVAEIGAQARDEWLLCFTRALEETVAHPQLRTIILEPVTRLAHHMQNKEEE